MSEDIKGLFDSAKDDGLDEEAVDTLVDNLDNVALQGCTGVDVDLIPTDDVTLVVPVLDASESMLDNENYKAVIDGFNTMIEAFKGSKKAESILLSTWLFNTTPQLLFGFTPSLSVPELTEAEYHPFGATALYDALLFAMTGLVAYGQKLRDNGVRTKCIITAFSDGENNSSQAEAHEIKKVAQSLLAQEIYILAYAGFVGYLGFSPEEQARIVGFPSVIEANATQSEIRRIFGQVSASIIQTSQTIIDPDDPNAFFGST